MKTFIRKLLNALGYDISRTPRPSSSLNPYCKIPLQSQQIVDLEALAEISLTIPGMISPQSGQFLYSLCYFQDLKGDVVEIGSWQGRSTSFLARAVQTSDNGNFYAIDHFAGNVGKEEFYKVNKEDLSDLKQNFLSNIEKLGLADSVNLLDMENTQAAQELPSKTIRLLFIDGDHTKEGVEKDIKLFFPKLVEGSIVVFDDFSEHFPGLIKAIETHLEKSKISGIMSYHNTLVIKV